MTPLQAIIGNLAFPSPCVDSSYMTCKDRLLSAKMKRSTIICQLADPDISALDIQKMLEIGVNIINMKLTWFTNRASIELLQKVDIAEKLCCQKNNVEDWPVASCVELKTCSIRTGILEDEKEKEYVPKGSQVKLTCNKEYYDKCNKSQIYIDSLYLTKNVVPGNLVSIKRDEIILKCTEYIDAFTLLCEVEKDGELTSVCSVNLKGGIYHEPPLMKRDYEILEFAVKNKVDIIMIIFTRSVACIKEIKKWLKDKEHKPLIIAGIATFTGMQNFEYIARESNAVILLRDELEFELSNEHKSHMPRIQKWMTAVCLKVGKQIFLSGGIFETAIASGKPTDSEIFDVSNALAEGAAGFMLKDCNNLDNTIRTLNVLDTFCRSIEPVINTADTFWDIVESKHVPINAARATAVACLTVALVCNAKGIIVPTVTGSTVKLLLSLRPSCTVYTVSTSERVKRKMSMFGSVIPLQFRGSTRSTSFQHSIKARINYAVEFAVNKLMMTYGDKYVSLEKASDVSAFCDTVRVWKVELVAKSNIECPSSPDFYQTEQYLELPEEGLLRIDSRTKKYKPKPRVTLIITK